MRARAAEQGPLTVTPDRAGTEQTKDSIHQQKKEKLRLGSQEKVRRNKEKGEEGVGRRSPPRDSTGSTKLWPGPNFVQVTASLAAAAAATGILSILLLSFASPSGLISASSSPPIYWRVALMESRRKRSLRGFHQIVNGVFEARVPAGRKVHTGDLIFLLAQIGAQGLTIM
ncbi:hypothetical protein ElyMa_004581900 [Elysia marginata]|uniref:Uncharacterized protein n=1 Tax=Elysia marginata TaxID=1093978 RepID=A0AAV4HU29_9GAST|nr:hypothetical protein ElyMa_004581900 [Elysia marginata]